MCRKLQVEWKLIKHHSLFVYYKEISGSNLLERVFLMHECHWRYKVLMFKKKSNLICHGQWLQLKMKCASGLYCSFYMLRNTSFCSYSNLSVIHVNEGDLDGSLKYAYPDLFLELRSDQFENSVSLTTETKHESISLKLDEMSFQNNSCTFLSRDICNVNWWFKWDLRPQSAMKSELVLVTIRIIYTY